MSQDATITFYKDKSDGSSEEIFTKYIDKLQKFNRGIKSVDILEVVTINLGESLRATSSNLIQKGKLDIFKIS